MARKFMIDIHSDFAELRRYDIFVMCGGFDSSGERCDFVSAGSEAASAEASASRDLRVVTAECDSIIAYVYVIPQTLPVSRDVDDCRPFKLEGRVAASDGAILYDVAHEINQWSGSSIEIKLPQDKVVREV